MEEGSWVPAKMGKAWCEDVSKERPSKWSRRTKTMGQLVIPSPPVVSCVDSKGGVSGHSTRATNAYAGLPESN